MKLKALALESLPTLVWTGDREMEADEPVLFSDVIEDRGETTILTSVRLLGTCLSFVCRDVLTRNELLAVLTQHISEPTAF